MKTRPFDVRALLVVLALAASVVPAKADGVQQAPIPKGVTRVVSGAHPNASGGGPLEPPTDFMTDAQREAIGKEVADNVERLRLVGKLAALVPDVHPLFAWPLRLAPGLTDPGYHGISNFVDLDPNFPNLLLDYNCGARSYDRSDGYNHRGSDIFTWPWGWRKMDRSEIQIVAAAPGQIIYRSDGNFDRSCGFNNDNWNAIFVGHADGSQAWYGHMKNGSVTPKQVGEFVAQGEYLGVVGSSGNSTGPHLHFEVYNASSQLIEPWFGPCNNLNPETWWANQRPYYDSAVDRITTGATPVNFPACPTAESPNSQSAFPVGSTIYFTTYYRDQRDTQSSHYTIYRPNGSIYASWDHSGPAAHYAASYWYWGFVFSGEMQGTWRFTVEFESQVYERFFSYGSPAACGIVPETEAQGGPLVLQKIGTSVRLTWGASCSPSDTDYSVYEGAIGNFSSHSRLTCTTSSNTTAIIAPAAGGRYFLIGARNATSESSLGLMSNGAERPVGVISCAPRFSLQCP